MKTTLSFSTLVLIALLVSLAAPTVVLGSTHAQINAAQLAVSAATPEDLILAMNTLRVSNGYPALVENAIIDSVAQATAQYMADNELADHIGNVSGRVQAAGYGGGAKVWATENFSMGFNSVDQIMQVWSDPLHMLPATVAAYCDVGAGHAVAPNGWDYYILQAAYTEAKSCGPYNVPVGTNAPTSLVPQIIVPVKVATPDANGQIWHVVQPGQSLWAIAISYKVTIKDIQFWNNLPDNTYLQVGEKLLIPGSNTVGYFTPTPVGLVQVSTPDATGKIIHVVQPYQTLITIAQAYGVTVDSILALNSILVDWPLQIGQKLVIHASNITPSATPRPLTPLEKLTPAADGKYYHVVKSGDTLIGIAALYGVKLADLLAWNSLTMASLVYPGEKLLLEVTPPATATATLAPATDTPSPTASPTVTQTPTLTLAPTQTATLVPTTTSNPLPVSLVSTTNAIGLVLIVVALGGLVWALVRMRKKG